MTSLEKLPSIRDDIRRALTLSLGDISVEIKTTNGKASAKATSLLARVSAAQQLTQMVMMKVQEMGRVEAARDDVGDIATDRTLVRLEMGCGALVTSLEALANDLKSVA